MMLLKNSVFTAALFLATGLTLPEEQPAQPDWQPLTAELVAKEKPGYGKLSGAIVDPKTGDVYVDLSDKGIYRSTDQGKSWERCGETLKGRTETSGCIMLDPTGKSQRMVVALVYGSPIAVSPDLGKTWQIMSPKSSHIDWCAVDWTDPALKFVLALRHESGGALIVSRDGGKTFDEVGKGYGPAWIFDHETAVVAAAKTKTEPKPGLLRTTDGTKTFQPCGDYTIGAGTLPQWHAGKLYWLAEGALITTKDKGASWQKVCDLKDGRFGPVFGKSAQHFFVVTEKGVLETTDGGANWAKPIPLPKAVKAGKAWLSYDPGHATLYVMQMDSDLYRLSLPAKKELH
jgi:hypothetical protein